VSGVGPEGPAELIALERNEFLADPEIPAIARELGIQAPPVHVVAATELDA
jgi:hypothetical protein